MSVKKRRVDDPSDTGKLDVYRDLEERLFKAFPSQNISSDDMPGRSIIEGAISDHDALLLRKIAAERKGFNDDQRRALLLLADLLGRGKK